MKLMEFENLEDFVEKIKEDKAQEVMIQKIILRGEETVEKEGQQVKVPTYGANIVLTSTTEKVQYVTSHQIPLKQLKDDAEAEQFNILILQEYDLIKSEINRLSPMMKIYAGRETATELLRKKL